MGIVRVGVASEEHGIRNVCSDIVVWEFEEDPRVETKNSIIMRLTELTKKLYKNFPYYKIFYLSGKNFAT
ncbi:hypothetical protein V1478_003418 [Vespula squamosa]|uniref:Uncharacterized protein n=1 Tax=Vespula squamosa TaxID=30214 RepID=A0ABD2BM84_VESSQ